MASDSDYQRLGGQEFPASSQYVPQTGISRYKTALQTLLPIRITSQQSVDRPAQVLPVDDASLFSSISFHWLTSYLWKAYRSKFPEALIPPADSCDINSQRLGRLLYEMNASTGYKNASMALMVWRFTRTRFIIASLLHFVSVLTAIISPVMIVNYYQSQPDPGWDDRFKWAAILVGIEWLAALVKAWSHSISIRTATRLRSAFLSAAYKKLILLSDPGPSGPSPQNLLSSAAALHSAVLHMGHVITAPLVIITCITVMWPGYRLMLFIVSASVVTLLLLWLMVSLSSYMAGCVNSVSALSTARLRELMQYFVVIKSTVTDHIFTSAITNCHERELGYMYKTMFCDAFSESILQAIPLIAFMLLVIEIKDINLLTSLLVIVLLYTHVRDSLFRFWYGLRSLSDASTALSSFKDLLLLEEGETKSQWQNKPIVESQAVSIVDASFQYRNKKQPVKAKSKRSREMALEPTPDLVDVFLDIPKGTVVGVVGSGKSNLLLAILGQLKTTRGTSLRDGTCVYVNGHRPWLIDSYDVRENILFTGINDDGVKKQTLQNDQNTRYYNTVVTCGLGRDLERLPLHEDTIVADLSLTSSQMQRITLARALYADRDIYLLDEPLNAVGAKRSEDIFKKAVFGFLKDKTVIIATHYTQFLNQCHYVVQMQDRHIVAQERHDNLLNSKSYEGLIHKPQFIETDGLTLASGRSGGSEDTLNEPQLQEPMYWAFGWLITTTLVMLLSTSILYTSLVLLLNELVSYQNNEVEKETDDTELSLYLKYVSIIGAVAVLFGILWRIFFIQTVTRVSRRILSDWLQRLIQAPVSSLSTGRAKQEILNCFYLHTRLICRGLPLVVERCLENGCLIFACFGVLLSDGPWSLIPFATFYGISFLLINIYRSAYLQISEMVLLKEEPLEEFIRTTVIGRMTIQSLSRNSTFVSQFAKLCDAHATYVYLLDAASHWVSLRIQLLSVLFVGGVLVAVGNDPHVASSLPMCLLVAWQLGGFTRRTVRMAVASESAIHLLKNAHKVLHSLEEEQWNAKGGDGSCNGRVEFDDVHVRPMLHGATFKVASGQHVGVFGSGRSGLVTALLRLVRPSRGEITIGGVPTSSLASNVVRSHVAVIPRGSPLLATDVRSLLNARGQHLDAEVWAALGKVGLGSLVKALKDRLRKVGETWTVVEREKLWLARAVVNNSQVVVLEECEHLTAENVREFLPTSTILTITGHPILQNNHSFDVIITVENGKVEVGKSAPAYPQSDSGLSHASSTSSSILETSI